VRLERHHHAPARPGPANRLERALELGRVVTVVVDQQRSALAGGHLAELLHAPVDAAEVRQRAQQRRVFDLELLRHGDRGERVLHVVRPARFSATSSGAPPPGRVTLKCDTRPCWRKSRRAGPRLRRSRRSATARGMRASSEAAPGSSLQTIARP
jgi:hypothetical protein